MCDFVGELTEGAAVGVVDCESDEFCCDAPCSCWEGEDDASHHWKKVHPLLPVLAHDQKVRPKLTSFLLTFWIDGRPQRHGGPEVALRTVGVASHQYMNFRQLGQLQKGLLGFVAE